MHNDDDPMLPALRQELQIEKGGNFETGAPAWLIHDPIRNSFFKITQEAFELISHWRSMQLGRFQTVASVALGRSVEREEISELFQFLFGNGLTETLPGNGHKSLLEKRKAASSGVLGTIAHRYLFFKIPLTRPQRFLDATWPLVAFLFTRWAVAVYCVLGISGLYLLARQWDIFMATFLSFFTPAGFLLYGVSLVFIKIVHELGHAYLATKYRLPVPVIGVAFLVLMPILYTDTSSAWRLQDKKKRLMIDFGGIMAELALAAIATIFWVFLPDGPARSIAFTTATLSWVMSLLVNLNPFMRFDGYYILSDWMEFENLQSRGFALGKWRLREFLFGIGRPAPEWLSNKRRRMIILHAWGTWIYRFFLFLGIALLVYHFFIKVVALFLFAVEIIWFIGLPVWREIKEWWKMKKEIIETKRSRMTGLIFCAALIGLVVPWSGRVDVPAIISAEQSVRIFPKEPGQLIALVMKPDTAVKAGEILARLSSPQTEQELALANQRIALLQARLNRIAADGEDRSQRMVLQQEIGVEMQRAESAREKLENMIVRAPFDGIITNFDDELKEGIWLGTERPLALIRTSVGFKIEGMINESSLDRLDLGSTGKFIPDDPAKPAIAVEVRSIADISSLELQHLDLAAIHGGRVPVIAADSSGFSTDALSPKGGWYRVNLAPAKSAELGSVDRTQRGVVVLSAKRESYLTIIVKRVSAVLIREFGL